MTYAPIGSMSDANLPIRPMFETITKKTFERGQLHNGVHESSLVHLEVYLEIRCHTYGTCRCYSCGAEIKEGELFGDANFHGNGSHCANCIEIPAGIEAWRLTYKMRRKSRKNPTGFKSVNLVHTPEEINRYMQAVSLVYGKVKLQRLYPKGLPIPPAQYRTALIIRKRDILNALQCSIDDTRRVALEDELATLEGELEKQAA